MKKLVKKFTLIFCLLNFSAEVLASQKRVIASLKPIASIAKMLLGDLAEIDVIQKTSSCPHHYSIKPSQIQMIKNADYLIFIDPKFELYLQQFINQENTKLLILSSYPKPLDHNFHFWVDIDIMLKILSGLRDYFIDQGFDEKAINSNYVDAKDRIKSIKTPDLKGSIIAGDSLRYLSGQNTQFFSDIKSLKAINEIKNASYTKKCIVFDPANDLSSMEISTKLVEIDIEDWDIGDVELEDYFVEYMSLIFEKASLCTN
ncbi:MAG: zinc ABC transporter substrate-binding protein [Rickettsiaceae bacterium]|nr:zinc ABC transporter substrate-binding protein [Rickettsiaceae bacterium]